MTLTRGHIEALGGLILAIILAVMGFEYLKARDDRIRMDATIQAQKTVIDKAEADRQQHAKEDAARDAATATLIATMQSNAAQQKTPTQIVGWSQAQLEQAIKGIQFTIPVPTTANPHPSAAVVIPETSLPGLRDTIEQCKECSVKLTTAEADLTSRLEQQQLADAQIQALKIERDSAIKAAKGGTWIQRTGRVIKWLGIGAAIGYAAHR